MDVFELRERVISDYRDFVTSFMSIKGPRVQEVVDAELAEGLLSPEARIALNPAYADGGWLDDLVAKGGLDDRCSEVFRLGKDQPGQPSKALQLRRHQVEAIEVAPPGRAICTDDGHGARQEPHLHHPGRRRRAPGGAAAEGLQFLVLDELHTYRGRQGADVALLVRRLRQACKAPALQCIGTSATMTTDGSWAAQRKAVASVASALFGTNMPEANVFSETLQAAAPRTGGTPREAERALRAPTHTQTYRQ